MRSSPALPGRTSLLEGLLRRVDDPAARLIVLTGAAGVGKSRILEALEEGLSPHTLVLSHVCRREDTLRGGALGGLLARLGRQLTPSRLLELYGEAGLRRLFTLSPSLLGRLELPAEEAGGFRFMSMLESLVTLLGRLSQDRPLLLILDDLQFIDETSRSLLEGLLAHPALDELGVTLLVACRDLEALPFAAEWERLLGEFPGLARVAVEPLDLQGMRELLAGELDQEASRSLDALVETLTRESGGLPFLAVLLLRHARRSGMVRATLEGWRAGPLEELSGVLRAGLVDSLLAPVLDRQPAARFLLTWLRAACVPVSLDPLRQAAPGREGIWEPLAQDLQRLGVLKRESDEQGLTRWSFAHALWSELSGEWLQPAERSEFLLQLTRCLDESDEEQRVLCAELLGRICRDEGASCDPGLRARAAELIRDILAESTQDELRLNLHLRLAAELEELSVEAADHGLAVRTGIAASLQINALPLFLEWMERVDLDRLDPPARLLVLDNQQRWHILRGRLADLPQRIEHLLARRDLCDAERASLHLSKLQWRYTLTRWEGAEEDFARLDQLRLLPEQSAWAAVLRCLAAPKGGKPALERLTDLENLLGEKGELLQPTQQLAVFHEMHNLAHLCAAQPRMRPWHDQMVEQARQAGSISVARYRDILAKTLVLAGRTEEAEALLRGSLSYSLRRNNLIIAAEIALFLFNLLRRQRRLGECASLADSLTPVLEAPPGTYGFRAVLLTACSIYWRVYRTADAARLLAGCEVVMKEEQAEELRLSLLYSRAWIRVQEAETGGDWRAAAEACVAMVDLYEGMGRRDTEVLIFSLLRDRALTHLEGPSPLRRAADYLPALRDAGERREFDLALFRLHIGELALLTDEREVLDSLEADFAGSGQDESLAAAFRLSRAMCGGKVEEASGLMLEVALQLTTQPGNELLTHLRRRWPELPGPALPESAPARLTCLWAWALANLLEAGRPLGLPGLEVPLSERVTFVRRTLAELREPARKSSPAERKRLERELERLEAWLASQDERNPAGALRLQVLGPVRLLRDGRELDPATLKTRVGVELLALLAIRAWQGRERLGRDEILEALTLDGRPLLSESSLRVVLSRLRKALQGLHPEAIRFQEKQGYALAEDLGLAVDALDFERAWTRAQDAQRRNRPHEAERHLDECVGLYRGAFLPGGASWTDDLRGHFERRFMDAARQRLRLLEGQGELRGEFLNRLRSRLPDLAEYLAVEA